MYSYDQEDGIPEEGKFKRVLSWTVDIVAVIAMAVFAVMMFGSKIVMSGRSMEPTLANNDVVLLDKLWYNFSEPGRMDVVAFRNPGDDTKTYIKRIVGLPGETVQIRNGSLYINGEEMKLEGQTGKIALAGLAEKEIELGKEEYFMLGDNPDTSEDSRFANVGNVRADQIKGRLWFLVSPFSHLGFVK